MAHVSPDQLDIREANPADAPAIGAVQAEAWRVGFSDIFDPEDLTWLVERRRTTRWPATFADPTLADTTLLVASRSARILGYVHFGLSRTEPDGPREIYSFNVHPDDWGSGAAAALMEAAGATMVAQGHTAIHLWTWEEAGRARHFYEKIGFQPTGRTRREGPECGPIATEVEYLQTIPEQA